MYCYYKCSVAFPCGAWVGLWCLIVVFLDHTHLLFKYSADVRNTQTVTRHQEDN